MFATRRLRNYCLNRVHYAQRNPVKLALQDFYFCSNVVRGHAWQNRNIIMAFTQWSHC